MNINKIGFIFILLTIAILPFRRLAEVLFSTGTHLNSLIIFAWKEVFVVGCGILVILKIFASRFRISRLYLFEKAILVYTLYCLLRLIDSHSLIVGAYGFVKLAGWVPFYFAVRFFVNNENKLSLIKKTIYLMLLFVLFSGIFIHLIGELEFRERLDVENKIKSSILHGTYIVKSKVVGNDEVPRLEGVFFDPHIPAYLIAIILIYLSVKILYKRTWRIEHLILLLLSAIALTLTYTRSAYVVVAIAIAFLLHYLKLHEKILTIFMLLFSVGIALTYDNIRYVLVSTLTLEDSSAYEHFNGFLYTMPNILTIAPLGFGLGITPDIVSRMGLHLDVPEHWGESFLSLIGGQIGLPGICFYLIVVIFTITQLGIFYKKSNCKYVKEYIVFSKITFAAIHIGALFLPVIFDSVLRVFLWAIVAAGVQTYVLSKQRKTVPA